MLSKRLLDRRLRQQAVAVGLLDPGDRRKVLKVPESAGLMAVRFDGVYRRGDTGSGRGISESLQKWVSLYTHPDVEPLLVLLDEGVHYLHLDFEQLQYIRGARDCIGLPAASTQVCMDLIMTLTHYPPLSHLVRIPFFLVSIWKGSGSWGLAPCNSGMAFLWTLMAFVMAPHP